MTLYDIFYWILDIKNTVRHCSMTSSRSPSGSCSTCISKIEWECLPLTKASEQRQTLTLKTLLYLSTSNLKEGSDAKSLSSITSPPRRLHRWAGTEAVNHLELSLGILVKVVENIFEFFYFCFSLSPLSFFPRSADV